MFFGNALRIVIFELFAAGVFFDLFGNDLFQQLFYENRLVSRGKRKVETAFIIPFFAGHNA